MFGKKQVEKMRKVLGERDKKCDRRKISADFDFRKVDQDH